MTNYLLIIAHHSHMFNKHILIVNVPFPSALHLFIFASNIYKRNKLNVYSHSAKTHNHIP
jgi:hypothetical protein